jgi:hypothetical protein
MIWLAVTPLRLSLVEIAGTLSSMVIVVSIAVATIRERRIKMSEKLIEIYWCDLTREAQKSIAKLIGIAVDDIPCETNWAETPIATMPYDPIE